VTRKPKILKESPVRFQLVFRIERCAHERQSKGVSTDDNAAAVYVSLVHALRVRSHVVHQEWGPCTVGESNAHLIMDFLL
jgi:hypothetical protein